MAPPLTGIGRRMAMGAGWMISLRFADRLLGLASTVILARLLVPADFGLIALATAMIGVLEMVGELSVEAALIQNQHAQRREYDTAWTMKVLKGLLFGGVLAALAAPASRFFAEPRLEVVVYWLALAVVIDGFQNIGVVNFRRDLQFHREFIYILTSRTVAVLLTMALAFLWRNYWALLAGMLCRRIVRLTLSYIMDPYRPRPSLAGFAILFRFSRWLLIENLLIGLYKRADAVVLGRLSDAGTLGTYTIAHEIASLSLTEVEGPIQRVVFPGFAKLAATPDRLKKSFLDVSGLIALTAMPVAASVAMTAHLLVPVVLGSKWLEAIPLIQILIFQGFVNATGGHTRPVYQAMNRPEVGTALSALHLVTLVPLLVLGTLHAGAVGTAGAVVAATAITRATGLAVATRMLHVSPRELLAVVWRVVPGTIGLVLAIRLVEPYGPDAQTGFPGLLQLALTLVVGGSAYAAVVVGLWLACRRPIGPERHLSEVGSAALRRLSARFSTAARAKQASDQQLTPEIRHSASGESTDAATEVKR